MRPVLVCLVLALAGAGCTSLFASEEEELAGSLAGVEGRTVGCTKQGDDDWFNCAVFLDSGWTTRYLVTLDEAQCWTASRVTARYGKKVPGDVRLRLSLADPINGCLDSGPSGDSMDGPGEADGKFGRAARQLLAGARCVEFPPTAEPAGNCVPGSPQP